MRWLKTEYIWKGIFLSLILYAALQLGVEAPPNWTEPLLRFNLPPLAGLLLVLVLAAVAKLREGYRIKGRLLVFLFFLLLESPTLVYTGILGGAVVGTWLLHEYLKQFQTVSTDLLLPILGGGALLGLGFVLLRLIRQRRIRLVVILVGASALAAGLFFWLAYAPEGSSRWLKDPNLFAIQLLLGLPFFYVLTFAGREEESEVESGAICAALAIGLCTLTAQKPVGEGPPPIFRSVGIILPLGLFLVYTMRILPALRVLKYVFRGLSHVRIGRHRQALQAFRRALQLDPSNTMTREGFWEVHRSLDLGQLKDDPKTLALVDLDLCLDRAGSLLIQSQRTPDQMTEAQNLLALVMSQRPELKPSVAYWQAVAHTHQRQYDQAAAALASLLDPSVFGRHNPQRQKILLSAWRLALDLHEELRRRVGAPQLALPGRRMEAIAAVERHLAENPADQAIWGLKRMLYQDVTEAEYFAEAENWPVEVGPPDPKVTAPPPRFDHAYVQQLGLALIDDNARWQRGGEYLRMAAHGQPALGPSLFVQIAQAHQRNGNTDGALHNFELAKRAGRSVGPNNLAANEAQVYFATLKYLAESAQARGDLDAAIEDWRLYAESPASGLETLRNLSDLYERKGDPLSALRFTDMALVYNPKDKDLLGRKEKYYYSVMPDVLRGRLEQVRDGFDLEYCVKRTQAILDDRRYSDVEWLDVAHHLIQLALVVEPNRLRSKLLLARVRLRYGERDAALALLEEVRSPKPEKFAGDDEDAWNVSNQLLGDLYVEVGRPDLALPCFQDFRQSHRSGAKTVFKMAQCYEQLGDLPKAIKCYKLVTGYDGNPLVYDANEALYRLGAPQK